MRGLTPNLPPLLDGDLKKPVHEAAERVPVSELVIVPGALSAAALHDDEFDDLLLE